MQVRCPRCPGVITVPAVAPTAPVVAAEPVLTAAPSAPAPPLPPVQLAPAGPGFMDNVTKFLAANGVSGVNFILLLVGLGCLACFLITVLCPWVSITNPFGGPNISRLGIQTGMGIVEFLLVLGILFMFVFVVLMGWSKLFDYCLWTACNLAIFISLHILAGMGTAGVGLILSLIVALAAAGTLGVVTFTRLFAAKPPSV